MVILNEAKPKYEKLNDLLETYLLDISLGSQVNIIIDLKEVLKKFFRPDVVIQHLERNSVIEEISSDIINIIGHYRNYFYKNGKYTTFYILYSFDKCDSLISEFENYKSEYYSKYMNPEDMQSVIAKKSAQVVERVCKQLPNVYFLETSKYDEFVVGKYLTENIFKKNELSIILSNDTLFYQLLVQKNIVLLNLKGIKTELANSENTMSIISKKETTISSNLLPLVLSIAGLKKYSIKNVSGCAINKALAITSKLVEDGVIIDAPSVTYPVPDTLDPKNKLYSILVLNRDLLEENYKFIRFDEFLNKNKIFLDAWLKSVLSSKQASTMYTLKSLNAKVFSMFPLQLDMILKGEKI